MADDERQVVAGIDVGTNSLLLLILARDTNGNEQVLLDRADIVRLGQGVDHARHLAPAVVDRAVAMLAEYAALCRDHGVTALRAAGTSALRDAADAAEFVRRVELATGIRIDIISGNDEAALSFEAVAEEVGPGPLVQIDIGGGSTEVVTGRDGQMTDRRSYDLGAVRLTERVAPADPPSEADLAAMRSLAEAALAEVKPADGPVVGTGGTITTLAAVHLGLTDYDPEAVSRVRLTPADIDGLLARLAALPLAERGRLPGLPAKRADIIIGGTVVLQALLAALAVDELRVSPGGLRYALARHALADRQP